MSYSEIKIASDSLEAVLHDIFPTLKLEEGYRLIEAFEDLAKTLAVQEIDRLFNRGDFR